YTPALCSVLYEKTLQEFHDHFKKITFDYKATLNGLGVEYIQGTIEQVKETQVNYDYLAICTGSSYADPWKANQDCLEMDERLDYLQKQRQEYLNANNILCIGGGPVGVEIVGEIAYRSPQKSLTLINNGSVVLSSAPNHLGEKAQKILKARGISLIMNEKAEKKDEVYVTDKSKQILKPDLVYNCVGVKPNTQFLEKEWVDGGGYVKVEDTLNVHGKSNVFALGDVNNCGEAKLYYAAHMQAMHFCRNLSRLLNGKQMIPYQHAVPAMFISIGPYYSVGTMSKLNFSGWPLGQEKGSIIAAWIKYIIEKINVQGGSNVEVLINQALYTYNNLKLC
ncbi:hypothetical protein CU098_000778, partial [Rhizopus stolonifer]